MTPSSRGLPDPVTEAYKKDIDRTLLRDTSSSALRAGCAN